MQTAYLIASALLYNQKKEVRINGYLTLMQHLLLTKTTAEYKSVKSALFLYGNYPL